MAAGRSGRAEAERSRALGGKKRANTALALAKRAGHSDGVRTHAQRPDRSGPTLVEAMRCCGCDDSARQLPLDRAVRMQPAAAQLSVSYYTQDVGRAPGPSLDKSRYISLTCLCLCASEGRRRGGVRAGLALL